MPSPEASLAPFLGTVVDRINIGIFIINTRMEIVLWNHFMEVNSGKTADEVVGRNIFDCFPELPRNVVENKIKGVFILKNFAFSSWEQRPYLFKFRHNRPVTGGVEHMYQDYTFIPIKNEDGEVEHACVTLVDVTDTAVYQKMLKEALASLAEASHRDGLTGIYNRHYLEESFAREFSRVRRYGGTLSLIMLDIDLFKSINDNYGHLAGDEVLRSTARHVGTLLRQTDIFGRYGGEEFALLLPETGLEGAQTLAERIRQQVAKTAVSHNDIDLQVTVSAGIAQYHQGMLRYEDLLKAADDALYQAKEDGRNRICTAPPPNDDDAKQAGGGSPS